MTSFYFGLLAGLAGGLVAVSAVFLTFRRRRLEDRSEAAARQAQASQRAADLQQALAEQQSRTRTAEEAASRSKHLAEIGTLTGGLAHEIKNPLSTVGLNLQLLQEDLNPDDPSAERLRHRLDTVRRETNRLRDILDDFLRYAGKLELDRRPVDLNRLLEELVDFFAPQAQQQRVQMRLRPHDRPVIADADPRVLKQAVLNLMINATQAMAGGGELILTVRPEGNQAIIDVIDTGPGIAPEAIDKIFHAYYSTKRGGSGIGLAMARRIADEHGGSLTVRSELGKGSDFSLRVPLAE